MIYLYIYLIYYSFSMHFYEYVVSWQLFIFDSYYMYRNIKQIMINDIFLL